MAKNLPDHTYVELATKVTDNKGGIFTIDGLTGQTGSPATQ